MLNEEDREENKSEKSPGEICVCFERATLDDFVLRFSFVLFYEENQIPFCRVRMIIYCIDIGGFGSNFCPSS